MGGRPWRGRLGHDSGDEALSVNQLDGLYAASSSDAPDVARRDATRGELVGASRGDGALADDNQGTHRCRASSRAVQGAQEAARGDHSGQVVVDELELGIAASRGQDDVARLDREGNRGAKVIAYGAPDPLLRVGTEDGGRVGHRVVEGHGLGP